MGRGKSKLDVGAYNGFCGIPHQCHDKWYCLFAHVMVVLVIATIHVTTRLAHI